MSVDMKKIFALLDQTYVNKTVLEKHYMARENFNLPGIFARNHQEFQLVITSYVQHHYAQVGDGEINPTRAFGEARRILNGEFNEDRFQEGFDIALLMALEGSQGGLSTILNRIADAIQRHAMTDHTDYIFHHFINPLSRSDSFALSRAYHKRFAGILAQHGIFSDEFTFARNPRAALEYHLKVVRQICRSSPLMSGIR